GGPTSTLGRTPGGSLGLVVQPAAASMSTAEPARTMLRNGATGVTGLSLDLSYSGIAAKQFQQTRRSSFALTGS
ncbi:MAG TPA: hypothetical protein VGB39_02695, partial [Sphingomicrobium sp.]